jgi:hypothetical protein
VRGSEIKECLRSYQTSVKAYCELIDLLAAVGKSLDGLAGRPPFASLSQDRLESVEKDLDCLGEALSVVPELIELLEEERRIGDLIRQQAARAGVVFRYDLEPPPEAQRDEEIEDEYGLGAVDGLPEPAEWKELLRLEIPDLDLEDLE